MSISIHDPLFYNVSTFMRRSHLSEKQIREFEAMSAAELGAVFFQKGVATAGQLFYQMLQSYRIAAGVANAAWGYKKAVDNKDDYNAREEWANLERALHDYSPGNFSPHRGDIQFAAEYFEALFNEISTHQLERWEEVLFEWTKKLHDMLESRGGPMEKPDVQRVVNGMARRANDMYPCIEVAGTMHLEGANFLPVCAAQVPLTSRRVMAPPTCPTCLHVSGIFDGA